MKMNFMVYAIALSILITAASINSPPAMEDEYGEAEVCTILADRLPCERAIGTWQHVCRAGVSVTCSTASHAIQMSRQLPHHMLLASGMMRGAGSHLAKVVGAVLGLLMMVLGKNLYKPLLFYLPAMLVGCAAIHPWVNKLETLGVQQGWTHGAGAVLGLLLAALQRHILVWLLGMLLGFLVFTAVLLWTPYLNTSPAEVVLAVAIFCAFVGSTVVCQAERTSLWRITVCALVGSLLVTDAVGIKGAEVQTWVCGLLAVGSIYQQLQMSRRGKSKEKTL